MPYKLIKRRVCHEPIEVAEMFGGYFRNEYRPKNERQTVHQCGLCVTNCSHGGIRTSPRGLRTTTLTRLTSLRSDLKEPLFADNPKQRLSPSRAYSHLGMTLDQYAASFQVDTVAFCADFVHEGSRFQ